MELTFLRLKNFLSFKELNHKFIKHPVLIKGKNLTEIETKETNGAGKSTMEAGIAYAILANPLRKQTLDRDLILWGEEEAEIWLDIYCPIRKQTLNIHRVLRQKGSATLELTIDSVDNSVQFATINDGNAYILNWIGITSEDLKTFYILNKENFKSFISSSNNDKLALINRFIKAEKLDNAESVVKEKIKPLEAKRDESVNAVHRIEGELSVYKSQLEEEQQRNIEEEKQALIESICSQIDETLQEYENAEKSIEDVKDCIEQENAAIKEYDKKVKLATDRLKELNEIDFAEKLEKVNKKIKDNDNTIKELRSIEKEAQTISSSYLAEIHRLQAILKGAVVCPHCGTEFIVSDKTVKPDDIRKNIAEKEALEEEQQIIIKEALEGVSVFEEEIKKLETNLSTIRKEDQQNVAAIRDVQKEITDIKCAITKSQRMIESYGQDIKIHEKTLQRCTEQSERLEKQLAKAESDRIETREEELQGLITITEKKLAKAVKEKEECEAKVQEMVQWGLRFKEFKMSLACEQLKVIQNFANLSLQKQHSELRLSIDGFKKNAKGKIKEEITVTVINGEGEYKTFWSFSGGERARIEMALIQAFQEMINGTNKWGGLNFLMIDEVLEGTDPLGLALLLESMNEVQHPVYIISHVMNIKAGVETLTVVKENGYSYIE